ncbi:hypothetical protein Cde04nite_06820 [Cellulomonas denverensis]|nr:hypothetical protein Cde04nite_06820 [Cellulomonas denverensis]
MRYLAPIRVLTCGHFFVVVRAGVHVLTGEDLKDWDWLPGAAGEIADYLRRLLTEGAIDAHDVSARHKSIQSFQDKCARKAYDDPRRQVTDCVAARIITYSITDRNKVCELIRSRFELSEDRMPGEEKEERRRGYDCVHLIATGERSGASTGWLVGGGDLAHYFERFAGLEIQVRTVAAHAWAEFEHHVRYKGVEYAAIGERDQVTIDCLFGVASDARRALDETFIAIAHILSNPAGGPVIEPTASDVPTDDPGGTGTTAVDAGSLRAFLTERFPDDEDATEAGYDFACQLVRSCAIESLESLSEKLDGIDGHQVRSLMATATRVTRVRRLDDELLAVYGEEYIANTGGIGSGDWVSARPEKLRWRYDRLRQKVNVYEIVGRDCPPDLRGVRLSAAGAVRELARVLADRHGTRTVVVEGVVALQDDAPGGRRMRCVESGRGPIWVAGDLARDTADEAILELLSRRSDLSLSVTRSGVAMAPGGPGTR